MTTHNENTSAGTEALSGQRSELCAGEYITPDPDSQLPTLQHRIGHIRLKARIPGACISLQMPGPITAQLLTIDEARQLIAALADLIGDLESDLRERRRAFLQMIDAADGSAESYNSKL